MDAWCREKGQPRGETLTLEAAWRLAHGWYSDRLDSEWRRKTPDEARALFASLGLTSPFWRLEG